MVAERVITVEYLIPSMSKDLLGKFPDSSAFGFNYAESGIWSPLLPRGRRSHEDQGKLVPSSESLKRVKEKMMAMKSTIKKKKMKKKNVVNKKLDFSPKPTPKRGWDRLLKAAVKRFKPRRRAAIQTMMPTI